MENKIPDSDTMYAGAHDFYQKAMKFLSVFDGWNLGEILADPLTIVLPKKPVCCIRVSVRGVVEIDKIRFSQLSEAFKLFALLWCYFSYNQIEKDESMADLWAAEILILKEKIKYGADLAEEFNKVMPNNPSTQARLKSLIHYNYEH